jgi:outer membrane protein OmpA-like peptidoglycan-associated protein
VVPGRVVTKGFGERNPVADQSTAAGREQNRRVVLRLAPITS